MSVTTTAPSGVRVGRATAADAELLAGFYRRVWDPQASGDRVREAMRRAAEVNPVTPGEAPPTYLFVSDGTAIGHVTTVPMWLGAGRGVVPAHWLKGLMVVPEQRKGPVGYLVLKEAVQELGCAMAMVVQPEVLRLYGALGFTDLGALEDRVKPLAPARVLRSLAGSTATRAAAPRWVAALARLADRAPVAALAGAVVRGGLALWSAANRRGGVGGAVVPQRPSDSEIDALWGRVEAHLAASPLRDAAGLRGRYDPDRYLPLALRRDGNLAGLAFVRRPASSTDPRLNGLRVAVLSDVLCEPDDGDALRALISASEKAARRAGADLVVCGASHGSLQRALRGRGFVRAGRSVHALVRCRQSVPALADWWLLRGDSAADDAF